VSGRVPVIVLSGFLGSGKTTLLRRALTAVDATGTAVVVNELGEIGLDQHQFAYIAERTVLLANGCLCCLTREDVAESLRGLLDAAEAAGGAPLERVVLETSGLADPSAILATIGRDPVLCRRFQVECVVVTCDAEHASAQDAYPEWHAQLAAADVVAVTKADRVDATHARALAAARNPAAMLIEGAELDLLRPPGEHTPVTRNGGHAHATGVSTASVVVPEPVSAPLVAVWLSALLHAHGPDILRIKALLDTGTDGPLVLDAVQHAVYPPHHLPAWPGPRESSLVAISRGVPAERIARSFAAVVKC
jgi:G3E family GTPase